MKDRCLMFYISRMRHQFMPPRALTASAAAPYLGVSRREFRVNWLPYLSTVIAGNRKLFDKAELDALFEQRKEAPSAPLQLAGPTSESSARNLQHILSACGQLSRARRKLSAAPTRDVERSRQ